MLLSTVFLFAVLVGCAKAQDPTTSTTIYQANYVARYTFLLTYRCSGPLPELRLECPSEGATIVLEGIQNDPDLQCTSVSDSEMHCAVSPCSDTCAVVTDYAGREDYYGSVYFRCEGPSVDDTFANFTYLGGDVPATCEEYTLSGPSTFSRIFHIHQLGVFCPDQGIEGEFVFPGQLVECNTQSGRHFNYDLGYLCVTGNNCEYDACSYQLQDSTIVSQVDVMEVSSCITEREVPEEVPVPPPAPPTPPEYPVGKYSTRYQAQWRTREFQNWCTTPLPVVRIKCLDGQLNPSSARTLHEETECTIISESEMECRETCSDCDYYKLSTFLQADNLFSPFEGGGVIYDCVDAAQPPLSSVEYQASEIECCGEDVFCNSYASVDIDVVDHAVTLGMYCGTPTSGGGYYADDNINDCSPYNEQVDMFIVEEAGLDGTAEVVCSATIAEPITVPADSDPFTFELPPVMIYSQNHLLDDCFTFTEDPDAPPASTNAPSSDGIDTGSASIPGTEDTSSSPAPGTEANPTGGGNVTAPSPPAPSTPGILDIPVVPP